MLRPPQYTLVAKEKVPNVAQPKYAPQPPKKLEIREINLTKFQVNRSIAKMVSKA